MIFTLIQYINFLTREGKSLLFRNYGSSDVDREILEVVLNSMKEKKQSEIKSTITDKFKYFYTTIYEILMVVCTDLEEDDAVVNSKIITIREKFVEKYGELLKSSEWAENRKKFTKTTRKIDDIILGSIKVSIIGLGGVGKRDLVKLICGSDVNLEYHPTINVDITNYNGKEIGANRSIVLWDFAGQSNFRSLWSSLLENTDIVLLVLDSSYESLKPTIDILRDIMNTYFKDKLIIGIANKQNMPNRLTPKFIEKMLSETGIEPPIQVHGMVATNPAYREKIHAILRDAIDKIYQES